MIRPRATVSTRLAAAPGRRASSRSRRAATTERPAKIRLLYGRSAPKPQRAPGILAGVQLEDVGDDRGPGDAGGWPIRAKTIDLVTRSNAAPPRAIDQKSNHAAQTDAPRHPLIRHPPASVHSQYNAARRGSPGAAAWRSARRTPRIGRMFPFSMRSSASLTSSSVPCSFSIRPSVNSWS